MDKNHVAEKNSYGANFVVFMDRLAAKKVRAIHL